MNSLLWAENVSYDLEMMLPKLQMDFSVTSISYNEYGDFKSYLTEFKFGD